MPPTLYVIRHAQGEHNVNNSHHLRDALLTDPGKFQCKELQQKISFLENVEVILASPLRRTIQTAAYTFAPELEKRQIPIVLVPNAQEISSLVCDIGHDAEVTISEAPKLIADAAPLWDASYLDTMLERSVRIEFVGRPPTGCGNAQLDLQPPGEAYRACDSWGFLHYFTEDWTGYVKDKGTGYLNCEYRKLEFTDDPDEESHLRERGSTPGKKAKLAGLDAHLIHEIEEVEKAS